MVDAVASCLTFTDEVALTLYRKSFLPDRRPSLAREAVLIPEVVEEREISTEEEAFGYNHQGLISKIGRKGLFIDAYL